MIKQKNARSAFGRAVETIGAVISASTAISNNRRPHQRHLDILGMDASAFEHLR